MNFDMSKKQLAVMVIFLVLLFDQVLKFWIKTSFMLGEEHRVIGHWFLLHFVENPGMAFGTEFQFLGQHKKLILTLFRIVASVVIGYYLFLNVKKLPTGAVISGALILAGALGNILDSTFYGLLFNKGTMFNEGIHQWMGYSGLAKVDCTGYAPLFKGCVVDMLYFPLIDTRWPSWVPFFGGESLQFFRPVFNIADSSITTGIGIILLFYRNIFSETKKTEPQENTEETNN
jgi:signal peptidase II